MSTPLTVRLARLAVGALALSFVGTACVPDVPPAASTTTSTTTTSTTLPTDPECVPTAGTATNGAVTLTVSQVNCLEVGDEVTVTGTGYTTTGNLGTRFPFPAQPAGVYVVLGEFADDWRPSAAAPGSARKVLTQQWAIPEPTFTASGGQLPYIRLRADGTFTATLTVAAPAGANPNLGFATYPGSGASNAGEELLVTAGWKS